MKQFFRNTIFPLFLMIACPPTVILAWHINTHMNGSLLNFVNGLFQNGIGHSIWQVWQPYFFGTQTAWKIILTFMLTQLLLMRIIPGKKITGPQTPKRNTPLYKNN